VGAGNTGKAEETPQGAGRDAIEQALADVVREVGPGNRLPSERLLAAELGVSRTALRDRLQLLEAFGVLRRVTGSGTYVQPLVAEGLAFALEVGANACGLDLASLHSVRVALERQAAIEAARAADPERIAALHQHVLAMERAQSSDELDKADLAFHAALFDAAGNPALSFLAQALVGALRRSVVERREIMRKLAHDQQVMVDVHEAVYRAVESGSGNAASSAMDAHFSVLR
jgi:DNA-binding FadR family transcriptional regulator